MLLTSLKTRANWNAFMQSPPTPQSRIRDDFTAVPPDARFDRSILCELFDGDVASWDSTLEVAQIQSNNYQSLGQVRWVEWWMRYDVVAPYNTNNFHIPYESHTSGGQLQAAWAELVMNSDRLFRHNVTGFQNAFGGTTPQDIGVWHHFRYGALSATGTTGWNRLYRDNTLIWSRDGVKTSDDGAGWYLKIGWYRWGFISGTDRMHIAGVQIHDTDPGFPGGGGGNLSPNANFTWTPTNPLVNNTITFTDTSTDDGTITSRAWDLDNDGLYDDSTATNPTSSFATAGTKIVRLLVTDNLGATGSVDKSIVVSDAPLTPPDAAINRVGVSSSSGIFQASQPDSKRGSVFTFSVAKRITGFRVAMRGLNTGSGSQPHRCMLYRLIDADPNNDLLIATSNEFSVAFNASSSWVLFNLPSPYDLTVTGQYRLTLHSGANQVAQYGINSSGGMQWAVDTYTDGAANPYSAQSGGADGADAQGLDIYAVVTNIAVAQQKSLTGTLFPDGIIKKRANKKRTAILTFAGVVKRRARKKINAILSTIGSFFSGGKSGYFVEVQELSSGANFFISRINTDGSIVTLAGPTSVPSYDTGSQIGIRTLGSNPVTITAWHKPVSGSWSLVDSYSDSSAQRINTLLSNIALESTYPNYVFDDAGGGDAATVVISNFFKTLAGGLPLTGLVKRRTNRKRVGTISFSGIVKRRNAKKLIGSLSLSGLLKRLYGRKLFGTLTFTRNLRKGVTPKIKLATLTFSGVTKRRVSKKLAATLSLLATFAKTVPSGKVFTAALTFSGTIKRRANKKLLAASLTFLSTIKRRTSKRINAILHPSGGISLFKLAIPIVYNKPLVAFLSFAGTVKKRTNKRRTGALTFTGALRGRANKRLLASLTFLGVLKRRTNKRINAGLSFVGSVRRKGNKLLSATLPTTGTIVKRASHKLAGSIVPSGNLMKVTSYGLAATLEFVGSITKKTQKFIQAVLTTSSESVTRVSKNISGTLDLAGFHAKMTDKRILASFDFVGLLQNSFKIVWNATLSFSTGSTRFVSRAFNSVLTFASTFRVGNSQFFSATLGFSSNLVKFIDKFTLSAILGTVGNLSFLNRYFAIFSAQLSFVGSAAHISNLVIRNLVAKIKKAKNRLDAKIKRSI